MLIFHPFFLYFFCFAFIPIAPYSEFIMPQRRRATNSEWPNLIYATLKQEEGRVPKEGLILHTIANGASEDRREMQQGCTAVSQGRAGEGEGGFVTFPPICLPLPAPFFVRNHGRSSGSKPRRASVRRGSDLIVNYKLHKVTISISDMLVQPPLFCCYN